MRLDMFLLADAATVESGKLYLHGGGITRLTPPTLPYLQSQLALVFRLEAEEADYRTDPPILTVSITDPAGAYVMPPVVMPVAFDAGMEAAPGEGEWGILTLTIAPVPLLQEGAHRITVELGDEKVREMVVPVFVPPADEGAALRAAE